MCWLVESSSCFLGPLHSLQETRDNILMTKDVLKFPSFKRGYMYIKRVCNVLAENASGDSLGIMCLQLGNDRAGKSTHLHSSCTPGLASLGLVGHGHCMYEHWNASWHCTSLSAFLCKDGDHFPMDVVNGVQ
jgi:hypothetical protein